MSNSHINIIRQDELEEIDADPIGYGVFWKLLFKEIQATRY